MPPLKLLDGFCFVNLVVVRDQDDGTIRVLGKYLFKMADVFAGPFPLLVAEDDIARAIVDTSEELVLLIITG